MTINLSLMLQTKQIQKQFPLSVSSLLTLQLLHFIASIASQVAGDYAISRQKKNSSCIWAYGRVKTNHYQNFSYAQITKFTRCESSVINVFFFTVEPRFNEVPRDWGNLFVISNTQNVRYVEVYLTINLQNPTFPDLKSTVITFQYRAINSYGTRNSRTGKQNCLKLLYST